MGDQKENTKHLSNGLKIRKLAKTVKDVQATFINKNFNIEEDDQSGVQSLNEDKETKIIEKWLSKKVVKG